MFLAALRDLQWRRKRFLITVIGTALVFMMTLLMTGLSNGFRVEIERTLEQSGGTRWVAPSSAVGPFSAGINIDVDLLDAAVAAGPMPGVTRADPVLFTRSVAVVDGSPVDINLFGTRPGALGAPQPTNGRAAQNPGEIVVARRVASIGERIDVAGGVFEVVGTVPRASLFATPSVFVTLDEAQRLATAGRNFASMIITEGVPTTLPEGLRAFELDEVAKDLGRPLGNATQSIDLIRALLWMVAALIVASVIYLSTLERTRDFAVFKATGSSTTSISLGLALQAVTIAVTASALGALLATLIAPRFPMDVSISGSSIILLPALAVGVGVLASLIGMRRVATVQPAARSEDRDRAPHDCTGPVTAPAAATVEVDELTVEFVRSSYSVKPIDGFSARVNAGTLALLLGPSGCGKTTLLSCLAGILRPTAGSIRVGATEVTALSGGALTAYRRGQVGIVFQAFNLVPSLDATENVMVPMRAAGIKRHDARARATELLAHVGLADRVKHRPGTLSGGQQRVGIARALALDPPLLIADEPTAALDHVQVENVLRILRGLADEGRTVIVSTHDPRLLGLADQVVDMAPTSGPASSAPVVHELAPGEVLFAEGARSERIYVVESGEIALTRAVPGTEEVTHLADAAAGEAFGEMGAVFSLPRSAATTAVGSARVVGYTVNDFKTRFGVKRLTSLIARFAPVEQNET